jgi:uncharacterized damage-inducible protein DinB
MPRIKWFERKFDFNFPVDLYPELIERFRGTPVRLEDRVKGLPAVTLTRRDGESWSIQENIGHLLDLEDLVSARLDDYDRGLATLRAADLENKKTQQADHNGASIAQILSAFRRERMKAVERLDNAAPDYFGRTAVHPRLQKPMRVVDMLFFQTEHDDHHLARISELIRLFK